MIDAISHSSITLTYVEQKGGIYTSCSRPKPNQPSPTQKASPPLSHPSKPLGTYNAKMPPPSLPSYQTFVTLRPSLPNPTTSKFSSQRLSTRQKATRRRVSQSSSSYSIFCSYSAASSSSVSHPCRLSLCCPGDMESGIAHWRSRRCSARGRLTRGCLLWGLRWRWGYRRGSWGMWVRVVSWTRWRMVSERVRESSIVGSYACHWPPPGRPTGPTGLL